MANLRVLVVEDDPDICQLLTMCLGEAGHEVVTTNSPAEVLTLLRQQQDFHFILLDFALDKRDPARKEGLELLPKIGCGPNKGSRDSLGE